MARSATQIAEDPSIVVVNPSDDTSVEALEAWITDLENDGEWIEMPVTAAELIAEDRAESGA